MMHHSIPTEIIQLFSASEVEEYQLIPFERVDSTVVKCYGYKESNYDEVLKEVKTLFDLEVLVDIIDRADFERIQNQYYRKGAKKGSDFGISHIGDANFLNLLIQEADSVHSSDIHFEPYETRCRVRMRIDGRLIERYVIEKINYPALVNQIKIISNLNISEKRLPQDGRILFEQDGQKFDVRVSVLPTIYGEKIVLRLLTREQNLLDLKNLGFDSRQYEDYSHSIGRPNGMILITGPTGSGKSTTLYATLRTLNREDNNILTIEDPVEYTLPGINQVQLKEDIGLTFGNALRTFLRQDPDIIMLGEIRDPDTAQMAIRSSLTGHLLLSTIHTNNAWGSISRLMDMGVHSYLIADTLVACVAQRLVRLLCPNCKKSYCPDEELTHSLGLQRRELFYHACGCEQCYYTGYSGRKAIYEIIRIDKYLSEAIRKNDLNVESYFKNQGIKTLRQSALALLEEGMTSLEEIFPILNDIS